MAEVVGRDGHVTAIEVDPQLAARARDNLNDFPNVEVIEGDGGEIDAGPADAILVNAGTTHPRPVWLDSLKLGARLLVPLTVTEKDSGSGWGGVLKVTRVDPGFAARFISEVGIFSCAGGRDSQLNQRLKKAFRRGDRECVQSLRRDKHDPTDMCWLHDEIFCLSKLPVAYLTFEGEQHGFRKAENIRRVLEAELYFYSKVFGFELADPVEPVQIENL
jgi:protein-L-isoaspartate(D-aspartate) O-methyltransferase